MSSKALQPIEQRQVVFYDDELVAVRVSDGRVFVPVRPICESLGVAWSPQRRRINRDPVLSSKVMSVTVTVTDIDPTSRRPQTSEMFCLPLDYISGFLFGINAARVKEEVRDRLIRYQEECYQVLAEAFQEGRLTADPSFADLLAQDTPEAQAVRLAEAILTLARGQLLLRGRVDDHEERLETIEAQLGDPGRHLTPDQASQLSQAVKAVAMVLSKASGSNQYGSVYGELYRKFGITSYKQLPSRRFQEAMDWLAEWHQTLAGDSPF